MIHVTVILIKHYYITESTGSLVLGFRKYFSLIEMVVRSDIEKHSK